MSGVTRGLAPCTSEGRGTLSLPALSMLKHLDFHHPKKYGNFSQGSLERPGRRKTGSSPIMGVQIALSADRRWKTADPLMGSRATQLVSQLTPIVHLA